MTVDPDAGHIAIGGTGGDMKNVIRIYDLQVRITVFLLWGGSVGGYFYFEEFHTT